ncbi:MAG: FlgD immunoglobulin-like domain containing protein [Polyangiaceae bacterium]
MPVGSVDSTSNNSASATGETSEGSLDRQAFLKLLVAQLSHQDPLKPMEGTEFVTQLAQFSAVEQALAQSAKLDLLSVQLRGLSNNEATNLVGKTVTVRGNGMAFDGKSPTSTSVTLGAPAASVEVDVRDADGNVVRKMEIGPHSEGAMPIAWDGKNDAGATMPAGSYTIEVHATDASDKPVTVQQEVTGVVKSVTFEKGYPELVLDSGVRVPVSDLVSVGAAPAKTGSAPGTTAALDLSALDAFLRDHLKP